MEVCCDTRHHILLVDLVEKKKENEGSRTNHSLLIPFSFSTMRMEVVRMAEIMTFPAFDRGSSDAVVKKGEEKKKGQSTRAEES